MFFSILKWIVNHFMNIGYILVIKVFYLGSRKWQEKMPAQNSCDCDFLRPSNFSPSTKLKFAPLKNFICRGGIQAFSCHPESALKRSISPQGLPKLRELILAIIRPPEAWPLSSVFFNYKYYFSWSHYYVDIENFWSYLAKSQLEF